MRVLLYGAGGWIGPQIARELVVAGHTVFTGRARLGGSHPGLEASFSAELDAVKPTHVVLSLGRTHGRMPGEGTIDYLEGGPDRLRANVRDNLEAPLQAASVCESHGVHMTYIGTGCIYEYDAAHPIGGPGFTEDDPPNFFESSYSIVKGTTDGLLRAHGGTLIARIRMPVGDTVHPRNFITKIVGYERVIDVPNSVTVLHDALPALVRLMEQGVTGAVNLVHPEPVSHGQVLTMYREIVDPAFTWQTFSIAEQTAILRAGRSNCTLDAGLLLKYVPEVKPTLIALRECMVRMRKHMDEAENQAREEETVWRMVCEYLNGHGGADEPQPEPEPEPQPEPQPEPEPEPEPAPPKPEPAPPKPESQPAPPKPESQPAPPKPDPALSEPKPALPEPEPALPEPGQADM